ncbi:hypothetical protein K437DRAFT_279314 [Tilletiaria anomala UBC 951]|uniref:ATP synthase complex subunit H n=1 Tax=Tilletiaria anomala (strain ATCC 24038 / CBS 436.72 / UBC 951) TaxID=1037660 RepID=A0A066VMT6_TILAU|nr:uncharacterized protein K437DRAFT_279314 [Tilletiaria anomala UBC 951]KDN39855.1 hypothetical protein K437DRAFT_279314 [Tilletiaria anomala UBC 951]
MAARFVAKASMPLVSSVLGSQQHFVQELYLRELKAYKPPQKAADTHIGQVREFATPSAPKAPAAPSSSELASQLDAYASAEPDRIEASAKGSSGDSLTESGEDVHAFLANAAADIKVEAHH